MNATLVTMCTDIMNFWSGFFDDINEVNAQIFYGDNSLDNTFNNLYLVILFVTVTKIFNSI